MIKFIYLFLIPLLISLSWILGGNLIKSIDPISLSFGRSLTTAAGLFFFSNIIQTQKNWTFQQIKDWWLKQFILALTGRAIYLGLSSTSLRFITPFEAMLISTILPFLTLSIDSLIHLKLPKIHALALGMIGSLFAYQGITSINPQTINPINFGHLAMLFGMSFFALHLIFYKKWVVDSNPSNTLFAQFLITALLLFAYQPDSIAPFYQLNLQNWIQFMIYSVFCNLLPFLLVHICIKQFNPYIIGIASLLSPILGLGINKFYQNQFVPSDFKWFAIATCIVVITSSIIDVRLKKG